MGVAYDVDRTAYFDCKCWKMGDDKPCVAVGHGACIWVCAYDAFCSVALLGPLNGKKIGI